jgi:hypothetical protein
MGRDHAPEGSSCSFSEAALPHQACAILAEFLKKGLRC